MSHTESHINTQQSGFACRPATIFILCQFFILAIADIKPQGLTSLLSHRWTSDWQMGSIWSISRVLRGHRRTCEAHRVKLWKFWFIWHTFYSCNPWNKSCHVTREEKCLSWTVFPSLFESEVNINSIYLHFPSVLLESGRKLHKMM